MGWVAEEGGGRCVREKGPAAAVRENARDGSAERRPMPLPRHGRAGACGAKGGGVEEGGGRFFFLFPKLAG